LTLPMPEGTGFRACVDNDNHINPFVYIIIYPHSEIEINIRTLSFRNMIFKKIIV